MKIQFWSIGKNNETYVKAGVEDFTKRISRYFKVDWQIIPVPKNTGMLSETDLKKKEAQVILEWLDRDDYLVLLDEKAGRPSYKERGNLLQQSLAFSINKLKQNKNGFFIMAEGAQVDWAAHNNKMEWMVQEVQDLDKAIGDMMRFVDENKETLLIVTADHETGGLSLLNGDLQTGAVAGHFSSNDHSAICVPVFAYGPQSNLFMGVYPNTEIFKKIMELFNKGER